MDSIIHSITLSNEQLSVQELASKNYISVRQLERQFKKHIGLSPKEYLNIVRFQNAIKPIKKSDKRRSYWISPLNAVIMTTLTSPVK